MLEETSPAEVSEHVRLRCGCARTEDEIGPETRWAQGHVEAVPPPQLFKNNTGAAFRSVLPVLTYRCAKGHYNLVKKNTIAVV